MGNYRLSNEAIADLQRIWLYGLEKWGEAEADKYYKAFFERFEQISKHPFMYPSVDYIRRGYRRSQCGVDHIYYRIVDGVVEIVAIIGKQDIAERL
jgi:toxin ParE1/3/4